MTRGLGQWNAYVEAGKDRDERAARLAEVPEDLRKQVENHVRTVFAVKRFYAGNARKRRVAR